MASCIQANWRIGELLNEENSEQVKGLLTTASQHLSGVCGICGDHSIL